jgi:hypothetical protein
MRFFCPMLIVSIEDKKCWPNAEAGSNGHNRYPAQTRGSPSHADTCLRLHQASVNVG